jgi:inositol 1,4,5-triphosphate receptor type 3
LSSGLYLSVGRTETNCSRSNSTVAITDESNKQKKLNYCLTVTDTCDDSTLFQLESTTIIKRKEEPVLQNSIAHLKHFETESWIHFNKIEIDTKDQTNEDLVLYKIGCSLTKKDNQALKLVNVSTNEIRNLDFVSDIGKLLKTYTNKIRENHLNSNEKNALESVLSDLILFLAETTAISNGNSSSISCTSSNSNKLNEKINENGQFDPLRIQISKPNRSRQELMREQLILDELFNIMKAPFVEFENLNGIKLNDLRKDKHGYQYLFKLCYRIIKHSQSCYKKNQVNYILC